MNQQLSIASDGRIWVWGTGPPRNPSKNPEFDSRCVHDIAPNGVGRAFKAKIIHPSWLQFNDGKQELLILFMDPNNVWIMARPNGSGWGEKDWGLSLPLKRVVIPQSETYIS